MSMYLTSQVVSVVAGDMGVIAVGQVDRDSRTADLGQSRFLLLVAGGELCLPRLLRGLRQALVVALDLVLQRLQPAA